MIAGRNLKMLPSQLLVIAIALTLFAVVQAQSSTDTESRPLLKPPARPSIEDRLELLEKRLSVLRLELKTRQKDIWDKLQSLTGLISGGLIALIGILATYAYRNKQLASEKAHKRQEQEHSRHELKILRVQIVETFMPYLKSDSDKEVETALVAIAALGDPELATQIHNLYKTKASYQAMSKLVDARLSHLNDQLPIDSGIAHLDEPKPPDSEQKQINELDRRVNELREKGIALNAETYANLGRQLRRMHLYDQAVSAYEQALEIEPQSVLYLNNAAIILGMHLKKYDEAGELYQKALDINPDSTRTIYNLACNEARQGKFDKSRDYLKKVIKMNKDKYIGLAKVDEALTPIRKEKWFIDLTKD